MRIFFGIIPAFAVILLFCFPVAYLTYARSEEFEMQNIQLSYAIDYAGEAAMLSCLGTDDIYTDYASNPNIRLSPEESIYTFAASLLLNYGLPASERNISYVLSHVPVMVLAEADGYYLAEHRDSGNGEAELMYSIKRPYTIDTSPQTPDSGYLYGVNLGLSHWYCVNKATLSVTEGIDYSSVPYSREEILQGINRDINLTVSAALERYAIRYNLPQYQSFYLPLTSGSTGVRRIEQPTLIVVVEGLSLNGSDKFSFSAVNGVAVTNRRFVTGWTDEGGKWFAYTDEIGDIDGESFLSPEDAASAGYWPWIG